MHTEWLFRIYYRFTGCALQFRKDPSGSDYIEGTTFETVYHLCKVDEILRDTFRRYIEKVEDYYRIQIACGFSIAKCTDAPYDQHYDENNFHNKIYREQLPKITPHVCRHTFCSNMAKAGMNPKTLQKIMGHSDIGVTLNTYTHLDFDDIQKEMQAVCNA